MRRFCALVVKTLSQGQQGIRIGFKSIVLENVGEISLEKQGSVILSVATGVEDSIQSGGGILVRIMQMYVDQIILTGRVGRQDSIVTCGIVRSIRNGDMVFMKGINIPVLNVGLRA